MHISDLVRHFSDIKDVPIEPTDVKNKILSEGMDLTIRFIGVELNTDIIRGKLSQYIKPAAVYGEDTNIADVYYATNQEPDWIRLVCCKELAHIVDDPAVQTSNQADVQKLIQRMALSPEFENLQVENAEGGPKVVMDRIAVVYAVAITFPWRVRELVMPHLESGKLNDADVARLVGIPLRYVRLVLSDQWPALHQMMIDP